MNPYIFNLAIRLVKREKLALAPIYLGLLFYRLDDCVGNIVRSLGCFHVMTHGDTAIL